MAERQEKNKQSIVEQVQGILSSRLSAAKVRQVEYFAQAFMRRVPVDELGRENPVTLAAIIAQQMKFAGRREGDQVLIRAFNPGEDSDGWTTQHTVIEMVNRDMPFLIDTTNLAMSELNLGVHLMVHPRCTTLHPD